MPTVARALLAFVALYPVCTAALWVAGGVLFRVLDERAEVDEPDGGWPGISVLIPAYNEESVIALSVTAALASDYPELEVVVLDDGSNDNTEAVALEAAAGDPRCRVVRDPENRGKAARLNSGFRDARHPLVAVIDADTHLHPEALRLAAARMGRTPMVAAVAGGPHVTNRGGLLLALQVLEAAAIIGLIRRTQSVTGRVGVVAGVLGLFHKDRVLAVGGYDPRMATEDIDLSWRLLLAGWQTVYEPRALVGMQVPRTFGALWAQRTRWARGQGEVMRVHLGEILRWRNRRMWMLAMESLASLIWVVTLVASLVIAAIDAAVLGEDVFAFALGWGIAIALVATAQLMVALWLDHGYDQTALRALALGAVYPVGYWIIAAAAALRSETVAVVRGPREERVVWDIPRESLDAGLAPREPPERV